MFTFAIFVMTFINQCKVVKGFNVILIGKDMVGNYSAIEGEILKPVSYTWPNSFHWKCWMKMWKRGIKKHGNGRNPKGHWIQTHPPPWNLLTTCLIRVFRCSIKESWMNRRKQAGFSLDISRTSFLKAAHSC